MPLIEELLAKQRQSKQLPIGEIMRAIGYGMGGRAEEYKPLEDKQGDDLESYITKELIKRQFEEQDPIAQLLKKAKVAEAAQTMGDRNLFNQIVGQGTNQVPNAPVNIEQPEDIAKYVSEIDPFTGKSTARAIQAQNKLEVEKQAGMAAEKSRRLSEEKLSRFVPLRKTIEEKWKMTKPYKASDWQVKMGLMPAAGFFDISKAWLQVTNAQRKDKAYKDFVGGLRARIARSLGEDVGNLSEYEQQVILSAVPSLYDVYETGMDKLKNLDDLVKEIRGARKVGLTLEEFKDKGQQNRITTGKVGGQLMVDINGNKAMVYPDGSFEEVQ